ncbi:MAG: CDP-alcohol phosphatidyltransferase family protein [Alphaproteobacteria bacterium]|jgi:cardiolipin synthase|nr:CDP-alcohol phosphatidyltransferase family protein [Alphaproteobacteria bacterium]
MAREGRSCHCPRSADVIKLVPNLITLGRLFAVPLTIWAIDEGRYTLAFWVFLVAAISDAVDGALARWMKARTEIGGYLDPLADKALLVAVYIALGYHGLMPGWLVIMVVSRDLLIVGGALVVHMATARLRMEPLLVSKVNTLAQIVLAAMALGGLGLGIEDGVLALRPVMEVIVALTTLASGLSYITVWGRRLLTEETKR